MRTGGRSYWKRKGLTMHVTPTAGRKVPDPDRGDTLPPEGREVEPTQYWQRRVLDGDVVADLITTKEP